jgi:hypothetical protein
LGFRSLGEFNEISVVNFCHYERVNGLLRIYVAKRYAVLSFTEQIGIELTRNYFAKYAVIHGF